MSGLPPTAPFPRWALAVDCTLSALSVVGGLAIIVGYICASQKQHLRLKLILGLGVTGECVGSHGPSSVDPTVSLNRFVIFRGQTLCKP